jgi:hypothetical protein
LTNLTQFAVLTRARGICSERASFIGMPSEMAIEGLDY